MEIDDGEGGQKQTVRLVKGPVTGNGDEECDARLQGERGGQEWKRKQDGMNAFPIFVHAPLTVIISTTPSSLTSPDPCPRPVGRLP